MTTVLDVVRPAFTAHSQHRAAAVFATLGRRVERGGAALARLVEVVEPVQDHEEPGMLSTQSFDLGAVRSREILRQYLVQFRWLRQPDLGAVPRDSALVNRHCIGWSVPSTSVAGSPCRSPSRASPAMMTPTIGSAIMIHSCRRISASGCSGRVNGPSGGSLSALHVLLSPSSPWRLLTVVTPSPACLAAISAVRA